MNTQTPDSSKWDWVPATQVLEITLNNTKTQIETTPSIVLTHPEGDAYPEPYVTLVIDTEKQLKYTEELGWNWHKSWNLPNIVVRLEIKDSQTQELLLSPKNLFAQLYAVKKIQEGNRVILQDVGLRGTSKLELIDGQAYFSALRFASTSYNNEGVKFHLLMCVYIQNSDNDKPQILNSTISPPIFVDSRKSAGNADQKKMYLHAEPFTFDLLDKKYFKRENKRKTEQDVEIENNFESLFNYLTAPNIRHKVKHPLFLIIKFSNCVQLFYNPTIVEGNMKQVMEKLQGQLTKDIITRQTAQPGEKSFYLLIEENVDQNKNKKVTEAIDFLNSGSLEIIRKEDQLPNKGFIKLGDSNEILENYKQSFDQLLKIFKQQTQKYCESDSNDSDDNYSESDISQPKNIQKKVKPNEPQSAAKIEKLEQQQEEPKNIISNEIPAQLPQTPAEKVPIQSENNSAFKSIQNAQQKKIEPQKPQMPFIPSTNQQNFNAFKKPPQMTTQQPQFITSQQPQPSMQNPSFPKPNQPINAQGLQGQVQGFPYQLHNFDNQTLQLQQYLQYQLLLQQQQQLNQQSFGPNGQNPLLPYMNSLGLGGIGQQMNQGNPQQLLNPSFQQQLQQQLFNQTLGLQGQLSGSLGGNFGQQLPNNLTSQLSNLQNNLGNTLPQSLQMPQGLGMNQGQNLGQVGQNLGLNPLQLQQLQFQQLQQMSQYGYNPLQMMMGLQPGQTGKKPGDKPDIVKQEPQ